MAKLWRNKSILTSVHWLLKFYTCKGFCGCLSSVVMVLMSIWQDLESPGDMPPYRHTRVCLASNQLRNEYEVQFWSVRHKMACSGKTLLTDLRQRKETQHQNHSFSREYFLIPRISTAICGHEQNCPRDEPVYQWQQRIKWKELRSLMFVT